MTTESSRRLFLRHVTVGSVVVGAGVPLAACGGSDDDAPIADTPVPQVQWVHGVASGDPLADAVILWTRVTAATDVATVPVRWDVAADAAFTQVVRSGTTSATAASDFTVKVDVQGLAPATAYHYRFAVGTQTSPAGRTRTLARGAVESVRLAVFSCANYPAGFFNAYAHAAQDGAFDAAVHLGDYVYEYGVGGYASETAATLGRLSVPPGETVSLSDYRRRYAQYRSDADLQALHAAVPMIAVWDDHEIANDAWSGGAENHTEATEGAFAARRAAAMQAWHEWLPTRLADPQRPDRIHRSFDFGNLVALHMLDTRNAGRDEQVTAEQYAAGLAHAPQRQLLGAEQAAWLTARLQSSTATWQVLGQQVLMARMAIPLSVAQSATPDAITAYVMALQTPPGARTAEQAALVAQPKVPYNFDAWDGYPAAREAVLAAAEAADRNLVVLSGDTHNAWASQLTRSNGVSVGVELATPSVTSPGFEAYLPTVTPARLGAVFPVLIDDLVYADTSRRGYMVVQATPTEVQADWVFVETIARRETTASVGRRLRTLPGAARGTLVDVPV